jgi:hypothetical protein
MNWWEQLLQPNDNLAAVMFLAASLIFAGAVVITKLVIRHRERMAMIEHGMDPDAVKRDALRRVFPGDRSGDSSTPPE